MSDQNAADNKKPRLLLVDDSKVVRASAGRILEEDFDVVLAEDGEQAWLILQEDDSIQAVFTDLGMPYLDGYGLLERIRQAEDERLSGLPVIIVTGQEEDDARADALRRGATDFITKPFNKIDLTARAKSHATYTRRTRELEQHTTLDPVTRLGNKRQFMDSLARDRALTQRHGQDLSVLYLEVHRLRAIAERNGKQAALQLLKQIGSVIRTAIREEDTAARIETGRFAICLPACDAEGLGRLARRLQKVLEAVHKRQAAHGVAPRIAIAGTTPSARPDTRLAKILTALEKSVSRDPGEGVHVVDTGRAAGQREEKPAAAAGRKPSGVSEALAWIAAGDVQNVRPFLSELLKEILPLLRLLDARQRQKLAAFLERADKPRN